MKEGGNYRIRTRDVGTLSHVCSVVSPTAGWILHAGLTVWSSICLHARRFVGFSACARGEGVGRTSKNVNNGHVSWLVS